MGIDGLSNPEREHEGPVEARIVEAPATVTDPVYVNVLGEDEDDHTEGPCAWMPRGATLPTVGDICAVTWTDAGTPIVTAWWPGEEWPNNG